MNQQQSKGAVALGLFDGVHLGHRRVLDAVREQKQNGLVPCAFTFQAETMGAKHGTAVSYIYPTEQKLRVLTEECGMEQICFPFFSEIRDMDGETFVQQILKKWFGAAFVCCGRDFRFGREAAWNTEDLRKFGESYGFTVQIIEDVLADGQPVSSSRIRELLRTGEIEAANALLSTPYAIYQEVVQGAQLGRTIGYPTINQPFEQGQLVPRYGVYASRACVKGKWYPAMTNVGMKPTVAYEGGPLAESHLIGFAGDLYGHVLEVQLLQYIRPEMQFASVEALQRQLRRDLERAEAEKK